MADQKRSTSASSSTNDENVEEPRNTEQDNQNGHLPPQQIERNTSDDRALAPHRPMDIDVTDRSTSVQTVQSQEEGSCVPHTQLVTGTTMNTVGNKGPVQIGTTNINTVIKNPVYKKCSIQHQHHHHHHHHHHLPPPSNSTSYNDYLRRLEQSATSLELGPLFPGQPTCPVPQSPVGIPSQDHSSRDEDTVNRGTSGQSQIDRTVHPSHHNASRDNTSSHVPCHCQDCLLYHHNDHRPLDEQHHSPHRDSKPRQQRLPHPPVPRLPSPQQTENKYSTKEGAKVEDSEKKGNPASDTKSHRANRNKDNVVQRSPLSTQPSDVTTTVTRAEQGESKQAKTSNIADPQRKENIKSRGVPRPDETSQEYSEGIPDSVCLIDSKGRSLEGGDPVWFGSVLFSRKWGIYVGHKQVVWTNGRTDRLVRKGELTLDVPFGKLRVVRGDVRPSPRGEVIRRAESQVGTVFTEGDCSDGSDFPHWAMTGLGVYQAVRRGLWLGY